MKFAPQLSMTKVFLFLFSSLISQTLFAQKDSSGELKLLNEIVVTSTRTENKLGNVAVPVKIISKKNILQSGSLRLKDILQEQAGLNLTNGFGSGIQMQGLSPDYTLILLNGEPLVGRTAGVLDINRIGISNIKKIEIVKGPSSSLYGSEAMAGVVNIITEDFNNKSLETSLRYGFGNPDKGWIVPTDKSVFKNLDFNINGSINHKKTSVRVSSNSFYIDGISYRPYSTLRVPQPIWRLTNQFQLYHKFSSKTNLNITVRHGFDHIQQELSVGNLGNISNSYGREANSDLNINPVITHVFNSKIKSALRLYKTHYYGSQKLYFTDKPDSIYNDEFKQNFLRLENQTDFNWKKNRLTLGAGYSSDEANSTRYDNLNNKKNNTILSAFVQNEWMPSSKISLVAGMRYDHNKLFAAALSPKLAARFRINHKISLNASIGRGFKAPDFRQLYLNFTNNAAGGYSVFGTLDAVKIIHQMQSLGQISEIKDDFYKLTALTPEYSTGINIGGSVTITKKMLFNFNLFRNDIEALIDVRQVATKANGAQIFSYINIKNAYTKGGEAEINWQLTKQLKLSSGYQYLLTADKDDLRNIDSKKVYTRNNDGISRLLATNEYVGLPNRSKHMANIKFTYENKHDFFATTRFIYKSKWYVSDKDGNGLINTNDEYANNYTLINLSAGKKINKITSLNIGIDNLLNYQDVTYLPNLQGRMIYVTVNFKLK